MSTSDLSIVPQQLVTNALIKALRDAGPGKTILDHPYQVEKPSYPYLAVFAIPGGSFSGPPLTAPDADAELIYQLDAIGTRRDQAQAMGDWAAGVVVGREASGLFRVSFEDIPGWKVADRMPTDTTPGGVEVVPAATTLYRDTRRFTLALTPQGT